MVNGYVIMDNIAPIKVKTVTKKQKALSEFSLIDNRGGVGGEGV